MGISSGSMSSEKQEITIPFGTTVDLSCDWYGPAKMGGDDVKIEFT